MNSTQFFSNPLNAQASMLLSLASLSEKEKRAWLGMLPTMTDDDKRELIANLQEDVGELAELEYETLKAIAAMD